jgi:hypothetical protein
MGKTIRKSTPATERAALLRQVKGMIRDFNAERWERCFARIDPRLREKGSPEPSAHARQLKAFREAYGEIAPWHTRASLYAAVKTNKTDDRPFAFVYIVWQDAAKQFHIFRERWVKDGDRWFTRVVGLVPARSQFATAS